MTSVALDTLHRFTAGLQCRPVVLLPALHLDDLIEEFAVMTPEIVLYRLALSVDSMTLPPCLSIDTRR
jgi:hypothetical protein